MPDTEFVFFYGSLITGQSGREELPGIEKMISLISQASVAGTLFDLGDYPGLILGDQGLVFGEVYRIHRESAQQLLDRLDIFERFDPTNRSESLFIRQIVRLVEPSIDAWLYTYNQDTHGHSIVASGQWKTYRQSVATTTVDDVSETLSTLPVPESRVKIS